MSFSLNSQSSQSFKLEEINTTSFSHGLKLDEILANIMVTP